MNRTAGVWIIFRQYHQCLLKSAVRVIPINVQKCRGWSDQKHCRMDSVQSYNNLNHDMNELTRGDQTLEKKLKVLQLEVDIWRQEGVCVPSLLTTDIWKELMALDGRNARKKYLTFCFKREMKRINDKKRKEEKKRKREEDASTLKRSSDPLSYGLSGNSMFMRIRETTINQFFNAKLIEAMLFSQELVVDCGYDKYMTQREIKNCGKQLILLFGENRFHCNPFNLYFCNAQRGSGSMYEFEKSVKTAYEPHFPLNITEKDYLDIFPKERLVYLTPHCREEIVNYDHDAVYIIGALVDKTNSDPLSMARAKEQGLKMAKLPLDRFLSWGSGSGKSLTLNQMIMIMLDLRHTGDWKKALQHVPSRKIEKNYQVDYSSDRFKLKDDYIPSSTKPKDFYNQLIFKRAEKKRKTSVNKC